MKNYEEMANDVLHRIDEYETDKKRKRAKITKVAASVTPVCAAAVVGVGLWKGGILTPTHDQFVGGITESAVSDTDIISVDDSVLKKEVKSNEREQGVVTTAPISKPTVSDTKKNNAPDNNEVTSNTMSESEPLINADGNEDSSTSFADVNNNVEVVEPITNDTFNETGNNDITSVFTADSPKEGSSDNSSIVTAPVLIEDSTSTPVVTAPSDISDTSNGNWFCDRLGDVYINGVYYLQILADNNVYTIDTYLGNGGEFEGFYKGDTSVEFYTAKENSDIVLVRFYDGTTVTLKKTEQ